ncbi:MAG TPA: hypothetical protein ENJ00_04145 [Phycisphaerales bacterium]|nr:hypothetical protein [Phycisphaerales bacterium]
MGPDQAAIPDLPSPPFVEHVVFESPAMLVAVLGVACVVAVVIAVRSRRRLWGMLVAGALLVVAGGVLISADRVTTDREQVIARTALLVDALAAVDTRTLEAMMIDNARLGPGPDAGGYARSIPELDSKADIITTVQRRLGNSNLIGSHRILETRAGLDGPNVARSLVRVRITGPDDAYLNHSWWGIDWRRRDGQWKVAGIEALWIQGG